MYEKDTSFLITYPVGIISFSRDCLSPAHKCTEEKKLRTGNVVGYRNFFGFLLNTGVGCICYSA